MFWSRKYGARRNEVRRNRPDLGGGLFSELKAKGVVGSVGIAAVFALAASAIIMLREDAVPYKPGQYVPQDVISRVDFSFHDAERINELQAQAREAEPRVYKSNGDAWGTLQAALLELPDRVGEKGTTQLPPDLTTALHVTAENDG